MSEETRLEQSLDCLRAILLLIDGGDLVRNTEKDADVMAYLHQSFRIVKTLQEAHKILEASDVLKDGNERVPE